MKDTIHIQKPGEHDYNHIKKIIKSAFVQNPYSNQKEHLLVDALRKRDLIDISLVTNPQEFP